MKKSKQYHRLRNLKSIALVNDHGKNKERYTDVFFKTYRILLDLVLGQFCGNNQNLASAGVDGHHWGLLRCYLTKRTAFCNLWKQQKMHRHPSYRYCMMMMMMVMVTDRRVSMTTKSIVTDDDGDWEDKNEWRRSLLDLYFASWIDSRLIPDISLSLSLSLVNSRGPVTLRVG